MTSLSAHFGAICSTTTHPDAGRAAAAGAWSLLAGGLLALTLLMRSVVGLDATETVWTMVLTGGLLSAGLAVSLPMTATLGVVAWAWFTWFVQPSSGELTFAGDDVQRLLVFTVSPVALSVFMSRIHHVIKENSHG